MPQGDIAARQAAAPPPLILRAADYTLISFCSRHLLLQLRHFAIDADIFIMLMPPP